MLLRILTASIGLTLLSGAAHAANPRVTDPPHPRPISDRASLFQTGEDILAKRVRWIPNPKQGSVTTTVSGGRRNSLEFEIEVAQCQYNPKLPPCILTTAPDLAHRGSGRLDPDIKPGVTSVFDVDRLMTRFTPQPNPEPSCGCVGGTGSR